MKKIKTLLLIFIFLHIFSCNQKQETNNDAVYSLNNKINISKNNSINLYLVQAIKLINKNTADSLKAA